MGILFTCIECGWKYNPDIDGDVDERMCFECLDNQDREENNEEL